MTKDWTREIRRLLILERGAMCGECGRDYAGLEFHHRKPTPLAGNGRGSYARVRDILRYRKRYILLCRSCHILAHPEVFLND